MRHSRNALLVATTLVALSTLAQAQQCPSLPPVEVTSARPVPSGDTSPSTGPVLRTAPTVPTPRLIPTKEIAASPALRRITSTGATVYEIGSRTMNHGLQGVYAVNGDVFRVFYLTPDGQALIGGVLWEQNGHNVTRDTVAPIKGAIPTVTITGAKPGATPTGQALPPANTTLSPELAKRVSQASVGFVGQDGPPRLTMVIDPLCPWSIRALGELQPFVTRGVIQLALLPIAINDHENSGASTPAATALLSAVPYEMEAAWQKIIDLHHVADDMPRTADAALHLQANMATANAIGVRGTPTLVWRDKAGVSHVTEGLPRDVEQLVRGLGR
ncbi:DsbC family protein [Acetobacter okinawensis]|uniref:DsbC family protein n=1 Tax=Acetobacter okinawensis TaxID=1076594 RepID=UPI001BAACFC4|nr:DsbC family protein [Acetobacter okinawensis]MBS0965832.1 DsbC family protein [Acetobacter okinawensis]